MRTVINLVNPNPGALDTAIQAELLNFHRSHDGVHPTRSCPAPSSHMGENAELRPPDHLRSATLIAMEKSSDDSKGKAVPWIFIGTLNAEPSTIIGGGRLEKVVDRCLAAAPLFNHKLTWPWFTVVGSKHVKSCCRSPVG